MLKWEIRWDALSTKANLAILKNKAKIENLTDAKYNNLKSNFTVLFKTYENKRKGLGTVMDEKEFTKNMCELSHFIKQMTDMVKTTE